jgi:hypothetical protein
VGGGSIPTLGATRARVVTAVGALATACVLGVLPAASGGDRRRILAILAATGIIATLSALAGKTAATWWAVAVFGAEYGVFLFGRDTVDVRAPIVGAGLLVLAELIHWSLRARSSVGNETGMSARHLANLGALCLGSLAFGSVIVAAGVIAVPGGLMLATVGVVGSSATLGLIVVLASRRPATSVPQTDKKQLGRPDQRLRDPG